jgi:hypothetical protein
MAARPRRSTVKALRLAFWNADGVRGRRIELNHFLVQHGVDVCLLNETSRSRKSLSVRKLCLPPNRPIVEGRRNSYSGPSGYGASRCTCPGSEAPGGNCHRVEVGWQTSKDSGCLSLILPTPDQVGPFRLLERRAPCPYGGWPQRQACGLELSLTTARGKLLRDYIGRHSCLIHGPDSPTTVRYNLYANPDVLDIAVTKHRPTPVHLTACSAFSSDQLPVLIVTRCRS